MARKRMIDPSFWEDEKLGTLNPLVRLLFMGLISQADDEGRLKGHPSLLRSLIFPYDEQITVEVLDEWLILLAAPERQLIVRYEVDNQKYIWIRNFKKHQTINKPQKSKLPEYSGTSTVVIPESDGNATAQEKLREEKLKGREEKGREEEMPAPDSNPHKDRIHKLINDCNITEYNLHHLDIIFSYIGVVDIEVIEAAIKKSTGKMGAYLASTLQGMVTRDGITKKEQVLPKPKVGEPNGSQNGEGVRQGSPSIHDQPVKGPVGLLPSKYATVLQMPKVSG